MSKLKGRYVKYSQYRVPDSDWLDDIPTHWDITKVKSLLCLKKGQVGDDSTSHQLLSLTLNGVIPRNIADGGKLPAEFNTYQVVEPGNLVFCLFDIDETPRTVGYSEHSGMITGAYNVYSTASTSDGKFVYYYFLHIDSFKGLKPYYTGLRKVVRADTFASIKMPLPSLPEQTLIANFLDHETAKIDTLIDKQQQLIKLLKEKRQAVINHAVTKGLNPTALMKDSGVEWLGEVPEHWTISRIGFHALKIGSGKTPRGGSEIYQDSGILFLRSQNVYDEGMRVGENECVYISDEIHEEMRGTKVQPGDILLNITGGSIARTCMVPDDFPEANVNQHVCILRFSTNINEYLSYVMKSHLVKEQIDWHQVGGNREGMNFEQISGIIICVPPKNERDQIVKHIRLVVEKYNRLEEKAQEAIRLIQERRTALISSAVTGKIDVRNWQPAQCDIPMEASA